MTKTEAKNIRMEIRALKAALTARQKTAARSIKAHRDTIRTNEKAITAIETQTTAFVRTTADRIAILEGRLSS